MKITATVCLAALLLSACVTTPSQRKPFVIDGPNGRVTCFEPPPDIMTAERKASVDAKISTVVDVLKIESSTSTTYNRIRSEIPDLQATEVLHFRLCTDYANGLLTKDQYNTFLSVLPFLKTGQQPSGSTPPVSRLSWEIVPVRVVNDSNETSILEFTWHDVAWVGSEGWLCGSRQEGGGTGQYLGRGILLHTVNGGETWQDITNRVADDHGTLAIFGQSWNGVGPIITINIYPRMSSETRRVQMEGWFASWTGIYTSSDASAGSWQRATPDPSIPPGFAHFQGIANVEAFREIYAVGWQGIAHWTRGGQWHVQLPTYRYLILAVCVFGDTQRDVWAVGRSGTGDEYDRLDSDSVGAIYHLLWPENRWERVPTGIPLNVAQTFLDILQINYNTVIVVGETGLVVNGIRKADGWTWTRRESGTTANLYALAYEQGTVWAVGDHGAVVKSLDNGVTWSPAQDPPNHANFRRIRFSPKAVWLVGDGILLKQPRG